MPIDRRAAPVRLPVDRDIARFRVADAVAHAVSPGGGGVMGRAARARRRRGRCRGAVAPQRDLARPDRARGDHPSPLGPRARVPGVRLGFLDGWPGQPAHLGSTRQRRHAPSPRHVVLRRPGGMGDRSRVPTRGVARHGGHRRRTRLVDRTRRMSHRGRGGLPPADARARLPVHVRRTQRRAVRRQPRRATNSSRSPAMPTCWWSTRARSIHRPSWRRAAAS